MSFFEYPLSHDPLHFSTQGAAPIAIDTSKRLTRLLLNEMLRCCNFSYGNSMILLHYFLYFFVSDAFSTEMDLEQPNVNYNKLVVLFWLLMFIYQTSV